MKVSKTNALRILDQRKIKYEVHEYEYDEKSLEGHQGVKEDTEENNRIYKTLVLKGQSEYIVFCLPITREIDLKLLAKASGNKSVEMLPQKDLLNVTGYLRGGCSPIGMKKKYKTYFQEDVLNLALVKVSAGKRGLQVELNPVDLINITEGKTIDAIKKCEGDRYE